MLFYTFLLSFNFHSELDINNKQKWPLRKNMDVKEYDECMAELY